MSDDDAKAPSSAASPMPAASLVTSTLEDDLVAGRRAVVVAAYNSPIEAQMAKSRLEADNIAADLLDENTVSIGTHLAVAVGGVKVRVLEDDVDRARDVLDQLGEFELPEFDDEDEEGDALVPAREPAAALAKRALQSGVVGVLFFPPLNLYSLWLAWQAMTHDDELTAHERKKLWLAVGFDVVGLAWLAWVLSLFG